MIGIGRCCVDCNAAFVPYKNDIVVLETTDDELQNPYRLWCADLLECPKCHFRLISGFGRNPIAANFEPLFKEAIETYREAGILFTISGQSHMLRTWDRRTN